MDGRGAPLRLDDPLVVEQLEKDLKFLERFLLVANQSCAIKRVDLVWAENGPAGRLGLRKEQTPGEQAVNAPCLRLLFTNSAPQPAFCAIVNDFGRHEAESCAISDKRAEVRVRETRKAEVYRCHAGLVDIAVPVICDGYHIATLFAGQVLREPPTQDGFVQIRKQTAALSYIDWNELESAYWNVPVISDSEIQRAVEVLELFADYFAATWKRLSDVAHDQYRRIRELQLDRKEFAYMVLDGGCANRSALRELMSRIGFSRYPNRVMVIQFESEAEQQPASVDFFDLALSRGVKAAEDLCDTLKNVSTAYVRNRGLCIFFRDRGASTPVSAVVLARKLLEAISSAARLRARVGIGAAKSTWYGLADSYREACSALAGSQGEVAVYRTTPLNNGGELSLSVGRICRAIADAQHDEARMLLAELPPLVNREFGGRPDAAPAQRNFFVYVLDAIHYSARQLGAAGDELTPAIAEGESALNHVAGVFELQEAFLSCCSKILDSISRIYAGRSRKFVDRARTLLDRALQDRERVESVSLSAIAAELGLSPGHLSRIFKRTTGLTFERYLMNQRIEMAKRMLLDPLASVSDVAERCGYSDPAYFARVFRIVTGCSPTLYREDPIRFAFLDAAYQ